MSLNKRLMSSQPAPFVASGNFGILTWTGNNSNSRAITGLGFKPDWVWIKRRNSSEPHAVYDSTRGPNKQLEANDTDAEATNSGDYLGLPSFDSDGFTVGNNGGTNRSGNTYVAWCWKAGGGTTSTNTDGANIDSTVQVNANAGFSIVKWTGTGNAAHTVGHGLGVTPNMVISKNLDAADTWQVYHSGAGIQAGTSGTLLKYGGHLDSNAAFNTSAGTHGAWDNPSSTALTFSNGSSSIDNLNTNNEDYIAYCFADVDGFSKFSAYEGNGSANGPIIETGFEPAFVMVKNVTSSGQDWRILDNKRNTSNPRNCYLSANTANAEECQYNQFDFLSNGFKVITTDGSLNQDNSKFIYMAFAADPDEVAPTLASSFNIETYTGTGSSQSITGLGFQPNFVWLKSRSFADNHYLQDSVRGATRRIHSNLDVAEQSPDATRFTSLDSDGFTLGGDASVNQNSHTFVAWAFKADDNEPTIFNGSARTVYKFEDNANDVTGAYNATASNVSYVTGYFNKAAEFNGSNSTMFLASSGSSLVDYDSDFSISLWFNVSSWATQASRDFLWTGGGTRIININLKGSTGLDVDIWNSGSHLVSTTGLSENTWYHLVFTRSKASGMKLYIDGSLVDTNLYVGNAGSLSGKKDSIGTYWDDTRNNFTGKIDQFRIYDGVITDDDVTALYAETASQNDDLTLGGPPQTIVSANSNAGMSIVKYDGSGVSGNAIPHGLSASPNMILIKCTSDGSTNWIVHHSSLGNSKYLTLNDSVSEDTSTNWLVPSATTFALNQTFGNANTNGRQYIAYCFHDVSGYQKFGSYTGTGSTGNAVTVGFKPDFVMVKATGENEPWFILDSRRDTGNPRDNRIMPDATTAEDDGSVHTIDFGATTFTLNGTTGNGTNGNNKTYIYWAIAKNVPSNTTLANSFKTVQWDGDGSTNAITGLGFRPDLVWLKNQEATTYYNLSDSVRGALKYLPSNADTIEETTVDSFRSFDSDGFTVGSANGFNNANKKFVAWCWKAGNTWQSNLDGSIGSIINANTGNGFSIVKYTGTGSTATIGHGLGATPEWIVVKAITATDNSNWAVYHSSVGNTKALKLSTNASEDDQDGYWNDTSPTSSVFTVKNYAVVNQSGKEYIAYCWAPKSGFSSFGNYTGNATAGRNITVGFQPDWILTKRTDANDNWRLYDSVRQHSNAFDLPAYINDASEGIYGSGAANNTGVTGVTSTAFTLGNGNLSNGNGHEYVYMAFKHN